MDTQASGWGSGWRLRLVGGAVVGIMSGTYVIGTAGGGAVEVCVINLFLLLQLTLLTPNFSQALTLSGVSRLLQSRWRMLRTLEGFGRIWSKFCASLLVYGQSEYEEVRVVWGGGGGGDMGNFLFQLLS